MSRFSYLDVREQGKDRYFDRQSALHRVLMEAPYLARCSHDKTATRVRPREYAVRYPYMQINRPGMTSWLIFDLDHPNAMIWDDMDLPPPNMVVRNRKSGHSHLYYAIPPVCTTEKARSKPIEFMRAVYEAMTGRLQADTRFHSGPVAKTPGHPWWDTHELHSKVYELGELAEYVNLARRSPWTRTPDLEAVLHSRHCMLFEELRFHAYSVVTRERIKGTFETFSRALEAYAYNHNNFRKLGFPSDLPMSSIKATVKSVSRWTWDRYTGNGRCHRGVMRLDKDLPLQERQRLAAQRSTALRQRATESKIRAACQQLREKGRALVQAAVAQLAGVSRQTVAQYKHILVTVSDATAVPLIERTAAAVKVVKSGVHQVLAALPRAKSIAVQQDFFVFDLPFVSDPPS